MFCFLLASSIQLPQLTNNYKDHYFDNAGVYNTDVDYFSKYSITTLFIHL